MPLKWKFFRFINYVVGFFYLLKLISLISFASKSSFPRDHIFQLCLFILATLVILLVCSYNVYLIKTHFPDKILMGRSLQLHIAAMIAFPVGFVIEGIFFLDGLKDIRSMENENGVRVLFYTWIFFLLLALIILVIQLSLRKTLRTNSERTDRELIDDLGR